MPNTYDIPGADPSPPELDPKELAEAERRPSGSSKPFSSSSTAKGRVNYNPRRSDSQGADAPTSTGTAPGQTNYTPDVPESEQSFYSPTSKSTAPGKARFGNFLKKRRKAVLIGAGASATIAGIGIAIFIFLLPLKLVHIMTNVHSHTFGISEKLVEKQQDRIVTNYLKLWALRKLGVDVCRSTIDRNCKPISINPQFKDVMSNTFRALAGQDKNGVPRFEPIEAKWARRDGLEFRRVVAGGQDTLYMKLPGMDGNGASLEGLGESLDEFIEKSNDPQFRKVSKAQARQAIRNSIEKETQWKRIMYRMRVMPLMSAKYGVNFCIFGERCSAVKDKKDEYKNNTKLAVKKFLVKTTVYPFSQVHGMMLECILMQCTTGEVIDAKWDESYKTEDGLCVQSCTFNGGAESEKDREVRTRLVTEGTKYLSAAAINDLYDRLNRDGILRGYYGYFFSKIINGKGVEIADREGEAHIKEAGNDETADFLKDKEFADGRGFGAGRMFTWVGFVVIAADMVVAIDELPAVAQKMSVQAKHAPAVGMFALGNTKASEIRSGEVDAKLEGGIADELFGPGSHILSEQEGGPAATDEPQLGGTAGAEQSAMWDKVMNGGPGRHSDSAKCAKGYNGPACQEMRVDTYGNCESFGGVAGAVCALKEKAIWYEYLLTVARRIARLDDWLGKIANVLFGIIDALKLEKALGIFKLLVGDKLLQDIGEVQNMILEVWTRAIFGNATSLYQFVSGNMSGMRNFDLATMGGYVAAQDFTHYTLGGVALTSEQANQQRAELMKDERERFAAKPLHARLFDTQDSKSMVSRIALAIPSSPAAAVQDTMASFFKNPFGKIFHSFGSLFNLNKAFAAPVISDPGLARDEFGNLIYGHPSGPAENVWASYLNDCKQDDRLSHEYAKAGEAIDEATQMPMNPQKAFTVGHDDGGVTTSTDGANKCLLMNAAAASLTAWTSDNVLTEDDKKALGGGGVQDPSRPTLPSGSAQELAQQILANRNIDLSCYSATVRQDIQAASEGRPGVRGVPISATILQLIAAVGQKHKVCVTSIEGGEHSADSAHYVGRAVDFGNLDGKALTGRDPGSVEIIHIALVILPEGSGFGQSNCSGTSVQLPPGYEQFEDKCHHLHIQVPASAP